MAYIGASGALTNQATASDVFNGNGSNTVFTLSRTVFNTRDIEVVVNNVQQNPFDGSYSVSGTTLTFSGAPTAGANNIYVNYQAGVIGVMSPTDNSVTANSIANSAVTAAKLHTTAVTDKLGYTPANKAGDTFTGAVTISNTLAAGNTNITGVTTISSNATVSGNVTVGGGSLQLLTGSQSNNTLALSLAADDTWIEQQKPDGTPVGRVGFNGYGANTALYADFDLYTRTVSDAGLVRRFYINGSTSASPNVEFVNVNMITRSGNRVWDAGYAPGTVLQAVQGLKTDTWTGTASFGTYTAITGLSASITPKSTSSRILIMTTINYDNNRGNSGGGFVIFRNGSLLSGAVGQAQSSQYAVFGDFGANANADQSGMSRSFQVIDSPSTTSTLTYDIRITQDSTSYTTYVNRARADVNQNDDGRFASSIILLEIAG